MAVLQGAGRICPPHVCVIQKTPCGIRLKCIGVPRQRISLVKSRLKHSALSSKKVVTKNIFFWSISLGKGTPNKIHSPGNFLLALYFTCY